MELLYFQRRDRVREIIQENPELTAGSDELHEAGDETDLDVWDHPRLERALHVGPHPEVVPQCRTWTLRR